MMFSKYIYEPERINTLFYGMIAFVLILLSIFLAFAVMPLVKEGTSIYYLIFAIAVIFSLPVFSACHEIIEKMQKNKKRMIVYANGNYTYSDDMRASLEENQSSAPWVILHRYKMKISKEYAEEAAGLEEVLQLFQKMKEENKKSKHE